MRIFSFRSLRAMTSEDLDAIVEIDRKVLGIPRPDYWKKRIELPNSRYPLSCLVAEYEGNVIGFIVGEVSGWSSGFQKRSGD